MLKSIVFIGLSTLIIGTANAQLYDRGGGMVYDSDQDITWVKDPKLVTTIGDDIDGRLTWAEAKVWVDNLEYGGYSDWRLPKFRDERTVKPGCDTYAGTTYEHGDCGSNTDTSLSELAYLFHNVLGNLSSHDVTGTPGQCLYSGNYCIANTGADGVTFDNLNAPMAFWTDTYSEATGQAIWFDFTYGIQSELSATNKSQVWVVRDGDSSIAGPVFDITDIVDAPLNTQMVSNTVTITGIYRQLPISIRGGSYKINNGFWTSEPGTVNENDQVSLRILSASQMGATTSATLIIGNITDVANVTTLAPDITPDPFYLNDANNAELSTYYNSNVITVTGINTATAISVAGGEYSLNGGTWTSAAGSVVAGDTFIVRRTSSAEFSTIVSAVLTVGTYSNSFDITTMAFVPDTTPESFSFMDVLNAETNTDYLSNTITVRGVNTGTAVSILAGEYRINGGSWTSAAGSVVDGDTITLRRNSSTEYSTQVGAMLSVGGYSDSFDITTMQAPDMTPDPFTFVDVVDADVDHPYVSNRVTITGIDTAVAVAITGGEYRHNAGVWTRQPQYIVEGDTIEVRRNSSTEYSTAVSTVLTVGTMSDAFNITTKTPAPVVCEAPAGQQVDPADQAKLVESELAGLAFSLDILESWSTGYCADIAVTNTTDKAKPYPYGVHFSLPEDTQFTGTWNGDVQRDGENITIIFPSWTQDVEANSKTLDNEQFGFCAEGISRPERYTHYVPDFSNLSIEFLAHNVWDGGYCGHFEMTYSGDGPYVPAPNAFNFKLSQSVEITDYWNEHYTRDGDDINVDLPFYTHHIYRNTVMDPKSGFCVVGEQLPCGAGYNGSNTTILEIDHLEDTYVAAGNAGSNYGDYPRVQADGMDSDNAEYVSLLKWDVSAVRDGVAITGAELTLNIYNDGGQYGMFAMHNAWSEMGATWYNTDIDDGQGMLIGMIEKDAYGETNVSFNERGIALVQQWVDGGENHGLMIRTMGSHDGIIFDSGEDVIEALRPKLSLSFKEDVTPVSMPTMTTLTYGVNGYIGTQDSYIKSGSSSDNNYGDRDYVSADGDSGSNEVVGLLKWDLSSIPSDADVVAIEIVLGVFDSSSGQYNLYAMNGSWDEANVTWNNADIDSNQGVLIGSVIPRRKHLQTIVLNSTGVQWVEGWIDGSVANNGLMIRSAGTTGGMGFTSREHSDVSIHPTIRVTYR